MTSHMLQLSTQTKFEHQHTEVGSLHPWRYIQRHLDMYTAPGGQLSQTSPDQSGQLPQTSVLGETDKESNS